MAEKRGLEMLLSQYHDSPNLKKYIKCFLDELQLVEQSAKDSVKYRYLSNAFGVAVDDIAYLVGASRTLYGAAALGYFGYYENPAAESTGSDTNPNVGGFLRSDDDRANGDFVRTDLQLKQAIRARVIKCVSNCNIDAILTFCDLVVGRELDLEIKAGNLSLDFIVHDTLPTAERVILAYMIPDIKPAGITATLQDDSGNIALVYYSKDYPASVI